MALTAKCMAGRKGQSLVVGNPPPYTPFSRLAKVTFKKMLTLTEYVNDELFCYATPDPPAAYPATLRRQSKQAWSSEQMQKIAETEEAWQRSAQSAFYACKRALKESARLGFCDNVDPLSILGQTELPSGKITRCYDSGATFGMTNVADAKGIVKGIMISIETGNGIIATDQYEVAQLSPNVTSRHVVLRGTSITASLGDLNKNESLAFQWLDPDVDGECGRPLLQRALDDKSHVVIQGAFVF